MSEIAKAGKKVCTAIPKIARRIMKVSSPVENKVADFDLEKPKKVHYDTFKPLLSRRHSFQQIIRAPQSAIQVEEVSTNSAKIVTASPHSVTFDSVIQYRILHESYMTLRDHNVIGLSSSVRDPTSSESPQNVKLWFQLTQTEEKNRLFIRQTSNGVILKEILSEDIISITVMEGVSHCSFFLKCKDNPPMWLSAETQQDLDEWIRVLNKMANGIMSTKPAESVPESTKVDIDTSKQYDAVKRISSNHSIALEDLADVELSSTDHQEAKLSSKWNCFRFIVAKCLQTKTAPHEYDDQKIENIVELDANAVDQLNEGDSITLE